MKNNQVKISDPWESLKEFTAARIALGRVGDSIPLRKELEFKLAHAHARDAVYSELNTEVLLDALKVHRMPVIQVHSRAENRQQYLQRPDLGRIPDASSMQILADHSAPCDVCLILADGLSANAINENAIPLLHALIPLLKAMEYRLSPLCIAEQARVAIADHIASGLQAKLSVILIGERPGLSSADSIGAYLTYAPAPGLTDESRNCISNIRGEGLGTKPAAEKILYLVQEAFRLKLSGVNLKDNAGLLGTGTDSKISPL